MYKILQRCGVLVVSLIAPQSVMRRSHTDTVDGIGSCEGKQAIEVGTLDGLIPILDKIKAAIAVDELDAQMETVSGQMRSGCAGKK
ncbi:hypothetical protein AB5985_02320 [Burkholderia cepacia]|uniref:hypothetical protein n=1 Tax=Burkholderia cepacia TaxID=292 RepID=UPI0034E08593